MSVTDTVTLNVKDLQNKHCAEVDEQDQASCLSVVAECVRLSKEGSSTFTLITDDKNTNFVTSLDECLGSAPFSKKVFLGTAFFASQLEGMKSEGISPLSPHPIITVQLRTGEEVYFRKDCDIFYDQSLGSWWATLEKDAAVNGANYQEGTELWVKLDGRVFEGTPRGETKFYASAVFSESGFLVAPEGSKIHYDNDGVEEVFFSKPVSIKLARNQKVDIVYLSIIKNDRTNWDFTIGVKNATTLYTKEGIQISLQATDFDMKYKNEIDFEGRLITVDSRGFFLNGGVLSKDKKIGKKLCKKGMSIVLDENHPESKSLAFSCDYLKSSYSSSDKNVFEVTDPQDKDFLRIAEGSTLTNVILPSGKKIPDAPEGKIWKVISGVITLVKIP